MILYVLRPFFLYLGFGGFGVYFGAWGFLYLVWGMYMITDQVLRQIQAGEMLPPSVHVPGLIVY